MHRPLRSFRWTWWLCLVCLSCLYGQPALAARPMRATILFDNSGSMRQNDPQRLSHVAAQLFLALARPQDQIGVLTFSDEAVPLCPLASLSAATTKQACLAQLPTVRFNGQTTNLSAALKAGLASFPVAQGAESRDLVLLLTDGQLDLGPQRRAEEPQALAAIRDTLLPQYRERGIAVYTIAFTAEADRALMQGMAQATGGEFRFIPNAALLHKAFSDLFVAAKGAESLPIQQGAVVMDASIQEASLILAKQQAKDPVSLVTPGKQRLQARSTHPGMHWQSTPTYDMIQLTAPEPGTWRVERASGGEQDVAIIGASTLSLDVTLAPDYLEAGAPLTIQARLLEHEQPLRDVQRLQAFTVQAELLTPEGNQQSLTLPPGPEDGTFTATITTPEAPGQYSLVVQATSATVQRQRTLAFVPQPRCFLPSVLAEPAVTVQVTLTDACPAWQALALEAGYVQEHERAPATWLVLSNPQARLFQITLPTPRPETRPSVLLRIRGLRGQQQVFTVLKGPLPLPTLTPEPHPVPATQPTPFNWWALGKTVGWQLLVVNLILGAGGGGGWRCYVYIRNRRTRHG